MSVETTEYMAMLARMVRAAGKRVADADEPELAQLLAIRDEWESAMVVAIRGMRSRGQSWSYIARALGTTRQAAQMRWGKAVEEAQAS